MLMRIRVIGSDTPRIRNMRRHLLLSGNSLDEAGRPDVTIVAGWNRSWIRFRFRSRVIVDHFVPLTKRKPLG